jgi:hypothetical protein
MEDHGTEFKSVQADAGADRGDERFGSSQADHGDMVHFDGIRAQMG